MKKLLILASAGEALTGLLLLIFPPLVVRLLLGSEVVGVGILASRVAGISLIGLALACWPDRNLRMAFAGMLTYSSLVGVYLLYAGINGWAGILLWPAVAAHLGLSALLVWAWRNERQPPSANT